MVLKRFGVWSVARVSGAIYGAMGLLFGGIFALVALFGAGMGQAMGGGKGADALFGVFFGVGAILFLPIFYGLMGLVMGALSAWLYNLFAGLVGGIEVELE